MTCTADGSRTCSIFLILSGPPIPLIQTTDTVKFLRFLSADFLQQDLKFLSAIFSGWKLTEQNS